METRKRVLGQEHPDTLISMANITLTYMSQGQWKKAEAQGVQVQMLSSRVLGPEHPDTLLVMHNLAYIYQLQGRIDEAIKLMSTAADLQSRILGEVHPNTKSSVEALAKWRDGRDCLNN
jgi:Tfp pilus assembly protein PilF